MRRSPDHLVRVNGALIGSAAYPYDDPAPPKAFLNYILFDDNYVPYDFGYDQIGSDGVIPGSGNSKMSRDAKVTKPGYLYVYLSNENPVAQEVYFDDLKITRVKGVAIEESDYYPFGLTFNSYQRGNSVDQRWKFQGQEHIDDLGLNWDSFRWRNHQPDIGRFFNVDPLSDKYVFNSPYAFSENKVVANRELEGLEAEPVNESAEIKNIEVEPNWNKDDASRVDSYTTTFTVVERKTYNTYDENNVAISSVEQVSTSQHSVVLPPGGVIMDSSKKGYANTINMPVKGSVGVVVTTTTTISTSSENKGNSSTKKELKPTGDLRLSKANTAKIREAVVAKGQTYSLLLEKFVRFIFSEKKEKKKNLNSDERHY